MTQSTFDKNLSLHIITYLNQPLGNGQLGALVSKLSGRKDAACELCSWRELLPACARAHAHTHTLLCSNYTGQLDAVAGCPITSIYYRRVVFMEFYFRASPTPWIPYKSSRLCRLQNVHTALWPNQPPVQWPPKAPLPGIKRPERQSGH
jgi:hypothetical protein